MADVESLPGSLAIALIVLNGLLPELELELSRDEGGFARAEVVQYGELLLLLLNILFISS